MINRQFVISALVYTTFLILLINLETTTWFALFGNLPRPHFWISFFAFALTFCAKRFRWYFFGITFLWVSANTVAVPSLLFLSLLGLTIIITYIRDWLNANQLKDFALLVTLTSTGFHFVYFIFSTALDQYASYNIINHLLSTLFTFLLSPALYILYFRIYPYLAEDEFINPRDSYEITSRLS